MGQLNSWDAGLNGDAKKRMVEVCDVWSFNLPVKSNNDKLDENLFHVCSRAWYVQSTSPRENKALGSEKDCRFGVRVRF